MTRGTTPTHTFTLPFDVSLVQKAMVVYAQNDIEIFRKESSDCQMSGNEVSVTLTQEDTLKLDCKHLVQVQLRVLTTDNKALASMVRIMSVQKCLNDEVL